MNLFRNPDLKMCFNEFLVRTRASSILRQKQLELAKNIFEKWKRVEWSKAQFKKKCIHSEHLKRSLVVNGNALYWLLRIEQCLFTFLGFTDTDLHIIASHRIAVHKNNSILYSSSTWKLGFINYRFRAISIWFLLCVHVWLALFLLMEW